MSTPTNLRIGDVAKLAGTTPRTIRYYEEIGLLAGAPERPAGGHRLYTQAEVDRLREVMRLKELLGVTLDELRDLLTAEEARAAVRAELRREDVQPERRRELLEEALGHIERQLELVEHRASELGKLREELCETRARVRLKLREQTEGPAAPAVPDERRGTDRKPQLTETPTERTDTPVADTPVADTPVADTPVADTPVADTPVADTPVADTPVADTPVAVGS